MFTSMSMYINANVYLWEEAACLSYLGRLGRKRRRRPSRPGAARADLGFAPKHRSRHPVPLIFSIADYGLGAGLDAVAKSGGLFRAGCFGLQIFLLRMNARKYGYACAFQVSLMINCVGSITDRGVCPSSICISFSTNMAPATPVCCATVVIAGAKWAAGGISL